MWRSSVNNTAIKGGNVYTFSVPYSVSSTGGNTTQQLTCPPNTTMNIIGAYFDIYDPYAQCLDLTRCEALSPGGECNLPGTFSNGKNLLLEWCQTNSSSPACLNTVGAAAKTGGAAFTGTSDLVNLQCGDAGTLPTQFLSGMGDAACVTQRDASAFVAHMCKNATSTCTINGSDIAYTGPLPCALADGLSSSTLKANYGLLPNVPMLTSSNGQIKPGNPKQGYTLHGIYACIATSTSLSL